MMNLIGKVFARKKVKTLRKNEVMRNFDIRRTLGGGASAKKYVHLNQHLMSA